MSLGKRLSEFSVCYEKLHIIYLKKIGLPQDFEKIKNDPLSAILYFTIFVHERKGANPDFQRFHRIAIRKNLNGKDFSTKILNDKRYPDDVWEEFKTLTNGRINEKTTKGPVRDILEKMQKERQPNIIELLGSKSIKDAHEFLLEIKGIKDKLSAFILRDLQRFFNLWSISDNDMYRLQPVDIWVRRFSKLCWPNKKWASNNHNLNAKIIVECCNKNGIDPVCFNQGAWFVGSHYINLCRFHNISEEDSINIVECVQKFNKNKVVTAIQKYEKLQEEIFVV
jgi:hypothetical protein